MPGSANMAKGSRPAQVGVVQSKFHLEKKIKPMSCDGMSDHQSILKRSPPSRPIHQRIFVKPDDRKVRLYGFREHDETPAQETLDGEPKASHMRWHPLRREWSVYASGRQNRTFKPSLADDPLAPTRPDGPATEIPFSDFELAIFDNRFPSFSEGASNKLPAIESVEIEPAEGLCEVVVYTKESTGSLATLGQERRELLVHAWIDRYAELYESGAAFVLPFENRGEAVGATLHHPHGQIYAFPIVPAVQENARKSFADGYDLAGNIASWRDDYSISASGDVEAFTPPFSRFPYEIWIAPRHRRQGPWDMTDEEISGFADLLGDVTRRYDAFFGEDTPYMLSLHAAPYAGSENWHFTAQFYPLLRAPGRLKYLASVEQSTGLFTVDVMPEETAQKFRTL